MIVEIITRINVTRAAISERRKSINAIVNKINIRGMTNETSFNGVSAKALFIMVTPTSLISWSGYSALYLSLRSLTKPATSGTSDTDSPGA